MPLTEDETQRLYSKVVNFSLYKNQYRNPSISQYNAEVQKSILYYGVHEHPIKYYTILDMDNDGYATDTVIKYRDNIYMVDSELQQIDEARMIAIFADQEILTWPSIVPFIPLASQINVFKYKSYYYFYGFINLLTSDRVGVMINTNEPIFLGVFIHKQHQSDKICEYRWINNIVHKSTVHQGYK